MCLNSRHHLRDERGETSATGPQTIVEREPFLDLFSRQYIIEPWTPPATASMPSSKGHDRESSDYTEEPSSYRKSVNEHGQIRSGLYSIGQSSTSRISSVIPEAGVGLPSSTIGFFAVQGIGGSTLRPPSHYLNTESNSDVIQHRDGGPAEIPPTYEDHLSGIR